MMVVINFGLPHRESILRPMVTVYHSMIPFSLVAPFQFDIYTWNIAEDYPHGVTVRIGMVSSELYMARFLPTFGYKELRRVIAEETALQEKAREAVIATPFSWIEET